MASTPHQIRQDISETREHMDEKLDLLQQRTNELIDWRHQVGFHPWLALGLAVAGGLAVAALTTPLRQRAKAMLSR